MMNTLQKFSASSAALLAAALLAGCSGPAGLFIERAEVVESVAQLPAQTNRVAAPGGGELEIVTPAAAVTNWQTNRVVVPNPKLIATLETVRSVNDAVNPLPFSGAISGVLGLAALALGWIAKIKSDKAKLVPALIQGIELARDPKVKQSVKQIATGLGLEKRLHREVKDITE